MNKPKPKIHCLKCWPKPYKDAVEKRKPFEFRKNDRDFKVDDIIVLQEWDPDTSQYTGQMCAFKITYITLGGKFGIPDGYCVLAIRFYPNKSDYKDYEARVKQKVKQEP